MYVKHTLLAVQYAATLLKDYPFIIYILKTASRLFQETAFSQNVARSFGFVFTNRLSHCVLTVHKKFKVFVQ